MFQILIIGNILQQVLFFILLFAAFYVGFLTGIAFVNWYLGNRKWLLRISKTKPKKKEMCFAAEPEAKNKQKNKVVGKSLGEVRTGLRSIPSLLSTLLAPKIKAQLSQNKNNVFFEWCFVACIGSKIMFFKEN